MNCSFTSFHSINNSLSSYCVPSTVLGTEDTAVTSSGRKQTTNKDLATQSDDDKNPGEK